MAIRKVSVEQEIKESTSRELDFREDVDFYPVDDESFLGVNEKTIQDVEGFEDEIGTEGDEQSLVRSISWICNPAVGNRLLFKGSVFQARCLQAGVTNIAWKAGGGWPLYTSYCPQPNYSASMRFRNAKRHQIVPVYGGFYWAGCHNPFQACGNQTTPVVVWVNDDKYDDNTGSFKFTVYRYS